jgi:uncharacterized protein involved in exopolysaccharide biosynthesis
MSLQGPSVAELAAALRRRGWAVVATGLGAGLLALGVTYIVPPVYTARTAFLPPQTQNISLTALNSLTALSGLAGGAVRNPLEQHVSLIQSVTVADRIIDRFSLIQVYGVDFRVDARRELAQRLQVSAGRRDGIIYLQVEDRDAQRAAGIARAMVEELGTLTASLTLTEAQQRRRFFESQVRDTRRNLEAAQQQLQETGFGAGAISVEPRAAAESYARLQAQITAAEIRAQALRSTLTDNAPEVQQQLATLLAIRQQRDQLAAEDRSRSNDRYVSAYREFKYQEALLEIFARQFELARTEESREGALIQVIDVATPPERRSWPKRTATTLVTTLIATLLAAVGLVLTVFWRSRAAVNLSKSASFPD